MKIKNEKGVTGVDAILALALFLLGTAAVLNMYSQIYTVSTKIRVDEALNGYITEIFEEIDLETYDQITAERVQKIITAAQIPSMFTVTAPTITKYSDLVKQENNSDIDDIVKRVTINISYTLNSQVKDVSFSKIKVKERT